MITFSFAFNQQGRQTTAGILAGLVMLPLQEASMLLSHGIFQSAKSRIPIYETGKPIHRKRPLISFAGQQELAGIMHLRP